MLKLKATTLVTMSYFSIFHPSDKCLFNSVNSCSKLFVPSFLTVDTMFATNTFFILFIIKIKIIINAVGFGSAKLTANVLGLCDGGAIEAQKINFAQKLKRRTTVELCSFAPLLQNPC